MAAPQEETHSAFSVLYIRQFPENLAGKECTFAPHITCGYRKDITKLQAAQMHDDLCAIVAKYQAPHILVLNKQVELGRPGNPKVIGFEARLMPTRLHAEVARHAEANEDGPFKVWTPHVSLHVGVSVDHFVTWFTNTPSRFGIETLWGGLDAWTRKAKKERYPRVRRVDGKDDEPIIFV